MMALLRLKTKPQVITGLHFLMSVFSLVSWDWNRIKYFFSESLFFVATPCMSCNSYIWVIWHANIRRHFNITTADRSPEIQRNGLWQAFCEMRSQLCWDGVTLTREKYKSLNIDCRFWPNDVVFYFGLRHLATQVTFYYFPFLFWNSWQVSPGVMQETVMIH